jgi:GMP synthase (glutamine-hydrolysing)
MTVMIVQHQESVPPGHIKSVLEEDGIEHAVVEAWRANSWPTMDEIGALIVLGGTMNVDQLDQYPFIERSRALMSDAVEAGVPTLGVCLGAQMLARVLGGDVYRAEPRNAFFSPVDVTDAGRNDPLLGAMSPGLPVLQFHEDTFELPEDATLLASSSASGRNQAFRVGDNAYGIQFHFEVDRAIVQRWLDEIGDDAMRAEWGIGTEELLRQVDQHLEAQAQAGRTLLRAFLDASTS